MIAATALANGLPVYTCNPNDFAGIDGLESRASGALRRCHSRRIGDIKPQGTQGGLFRLESDARVRQAVRTSRPTNLLISRSHSTALAIAAQNTQSWEVKLTVPNAR
jgi:hypothetical protein